MPFGMHKAYASAEKARHERVPGEATGCLLCSSHLQNNPNASAHALVSRTAARPESRVPASGLHLPASGLRLHNQMFISKHRHWQIAPPTARLMQHARLIRSPEPGRPRTDKLPRTLRSEALPVDATDNRLSL
jgi:hypothetical protein